MQSLLQYRRFGQHVKAQIERDQHHASIKETDHDDTPSSSPPTIPTAVLPTPLEKEEGLLPDLEKGVVSSPSGSTEEDDEPREEAEPNERASTSTNDEEQGAAPERPSGLARTHTETTQHSAGTALGLTLTGIDVRDRTTKEGGERGKVFVVSYQGDDDPLNPHNWSFWTRIAATMQVASIGWVVGFASAVDSAALPQASKEFGVSDVVESMATGLFLAGFGCGALFAGPFSETWGRNPVYISTLTLYMIFTMAAGLAPNIGAQLTFRFLAGLFGSTPLTCAGGSIADLWTPMERVFAFPVFANAAFMGPIFGPIVGGWIAQSTLVSWRWTEWSTLIISGVILFNVTLFQPETYPGTLLKWKSEWLRKYTGDSRYRAPLEIQEMTFAQKMKTALYRPFIMTAREPIIILVALYLTVIYIVLFTFLDGYDYIYGEIHGFSQGLTGTCFIGIAIGLTISSALVPLIYKWAKRDLAAIKEAGGNRLPPEFRLWYSMLGGAVAIPVSLFWMGWTSSPSISVWSPLAASVLFGYGILSVFISCYQYIIDSYELFAASGLASVTFLRYIASGGMVVVGIPFYKSVGVPWTCTILGIISALLVPFPYVAFKYGHKIRQKSRYAVNSTIVR